MLVILAAPARSRASSEVVFRHAKNPKQSIEAQNGKTQPSTPPPGGGGLTKVWQEIEPSFM